MMQKTRIGSILHGAYGDYYEQMLSLKKLKKENPDIHLVLFFATESRFEEMRVFDFSFADEVHLASCLHSVRVDRFHQYQIKDSELNANILSQLDAATLAKFDVERVRKPWKDVRTLDFKDPANRIGLSELGRKRLPDCIQRNRVDESLFDTHFTVGFLWRYRQPGEGIPSIGQAPVEETIRTKSELLSALIRDYGAHVFVCGMNVKTTQENLVRTDNKYTDRHLDIDPAHSTYLQGLSWGLELEIMRRCSLCITMPSGFSEALLMWRDKPTVMVDAPLLYLLRLLYNRMPFFDILSVREFVYQLRQPHTKDRVLANLKRKGYLPE